MSHNYNSMDLGSLKALLAEKKALLANEPLDIHNVETRTIYNDLKSLQYEISLREAQTNIASAEEMAP